MIENNRKRLSYRRKIMLYLLISFLGFVTAVSTLQYLREKEYKERELESTLRVYTELIDRYIESNPPNEFTYVNNLLPGNLRLTIIDKDGKVRYDNAALTPVSQMSNHSDRAEILSASSTGEGSSVRTSETTSREYFYFAKQYDDFFIRVALPNDHLLRRDLQADQYFIYFFIFLFIIAISLIVYLSDRFGRTVVQLRNFIRSLEKSPAQAAQIRFPKNEIGEISEKMANAYSQLKAKNKELAREQEKFNRHFQYLNQGVSIYSPERKCIYSNVRFIQNLNMITDEPTFQSEEIFSTREFAQMLDFLSENTQIAKTAANPPLWQNRISKSGHQFEVQMLIFKDSSFEIILTNITEIQNERDLKFNMTNNIAHELRTPVNSICGYLETIIDQKGRIEPEREEFFLQRAYSQANRLSDLIRDISLITKTESARELFEQEPFEIRSLVGDILQDYSKEITKKNATLSLDIPSDVVVIGNFTLLYALFSNLIDNSLKYAGEGTLIHICLYAQDSEHYYFRYRDNGVGVTSEHLNRIFDRFYRIDPARSRSSGGSGLGLSIVRNAVSFHHGEISAKKAKDGGLEYLFTLSSKSE